MRRIILYLLAGFTAVVLAAPPAYDESADAEADVNSALIDAKASGLPVLILFGANWCGDCRALDLVLKEGKSAELVAKAFKVVKVDVGNFDRNQDLAETYGNPIKAGIPAAVVLSVDGKVLYITKAGELSNARRMSETGIYEFFKGLTESLGSGIQAGVQRGI